ncbi:MAG: HEAT repeat domain-containing protein, partial [Gemmatimonadales bacterium]
MAKIPPPSPDVKPLGRLEGPVGGDATVVLLRRVDHQPWARVRANDAVAGGDHLLSLPAFASNVRLESGVGLHLHGALPGHNGADPTYPLYETEVVLHVPPPGFDADVTLDVGRIHLVNRKPQGEAKVLVRFRDQSWQVTLLDSTSEVIMDLLSRYQDPEQFNPAGGGEPPSLGVALGAFKGRARLQTDPYAASLPLQAAPAGQLVQVPVVAIWDGKLGRLAPINASPSFWGRKPETPDQRRGDLDLDQAKRALHQRLSRPDSAVEVALAEMVNGPVEAQRRLAVFGLEAIRALPALLDALQDEQHKDVRDAAVQALIHYVGEAPDNNRRLFEVLTQNKDYKPADAVALVQLLQGIPEKDKADPKMYQFMLTVLNSERLG